MKPGRNPRWQTGASLNFNRNYTWDMVRAEATGRWCEILPALGISQSHLSKRHGPCPACGGRDRFRFDDKNGSGSFFCSHCGAGDGFKLVQIVFDVSPGRALRAVAELIGLDRRNAGSEIRVVRKPSTIEPSEICPQPTKERYLRRLWSQSVPISEGDPVDRYLRHTRALNLELMPAVLRFVEQLEYREEQNPGAWITTGVFPAMLARVIAPNGSLVGIHRTYLKTDGQKAEVPSPRKLSATYPGSTKGGSIRLYSAAEVLGVAEGIETAIACHVATGLPVWSTISAGGLASLVVPDTVKELIIFADNDATGTGERAARSLAKRMLSEDRKVKILKPSDVGTDWADNA